VTPGNLFQCLSCGGPRQEVVFPAEMAIIEAVLSRRRRPENRNWQPGETVADLVRENEEHPEGMRED